MVIAESTHFLRHFLRAVDKATIHDNRPPAFALPFLVNASLFCRQTPALPALALVCYSIVGHRGILLSFQFSEPAFAFGSVSEGHPVVQAEEAEGTVCFAKLPRAHCALCLCVLIHAFAEI